MRDKTQQSPSVKVDRLGAALSLRSLRGRMALLLGLALLPMGVLAVQSGLTAAALRHAATQEAAASVELKEMSDRAVGVSRLRTVTRALAANAVVAANGQRRCNALLGGLDAEFAEFDAVVVFDARAQVRCAANAAAVGRIAAGQDIIDAARARGDVVVAFLPAPALSSSPVLAAAAPIRGAEGLYAGVSRPSLPFLARTTGNAAAPGGYAALLDGRGRILQIDGVPLEGATARTLAQTLARTDATSWRKPFRVGDSWAVASQLPDLDLYLLRGWKPPPGSAFDTLRGLWAFAAPLLLWFAAVGVCWWAFESYVARPLSTLEILARSYARGEDKATPANFQNAPDEFLSLRRTLAAMAKTLRGREKRIAEALQEERALLREVNHRVKNNLQVVASILSILSRAAENDQQATGLARAQDRVQLLALAQNEIHSSGEVRDVRLDKLATEICGALVAARGPRTANVKVQCAFETARTTVDHAVPFAFLIGESLMQALDALADGAPSVLSLSLQSDVEGNIAFMITSPDLNAAHVAPPIAHRIIDGFARQIGATVEYAPSGAFMVRIKLRKDALELAQ